MSNHKNMRWYGAGWSQTKGEYERFRSPNGDDVVVYGSFKNLEEAQKAAYEEWKNK